MRGSAAGRLDSHCVGAGLSRARQCHGSATVYSTTAESAHESRGSATDFEGSSGAVTVLCGDSDFRVP